MISVLEEIDKLRKSSPFAIDYNNSNRFRMVACEPDGNKTAYYFSVPIYNDKSRKLIDMKFNRKGDNIYMVGSNSRVTISDTVYMENSDGYCKLTLPSKPLWISERELSYNGGKLSATTNGLVFGMLCSNNTPFNINIEVSKPFMEVRVNDKCLALMREKFRPFIAFSCIGCVDVNNDVIAPMRIQYQKINDLKFSLSFVPTSSVCKWMVFEVNLYEPKLFQDTTVESNHPNVNNVFGGVGFIGKTKEYGEQWLYSRPDFSRLTELSYQNIQKAVLHIPQLNSAYLGMEVLRPSARFCSFGSNWENKISVSSDSKKISLNTRYIDVDITSLISDSAGRFKMSEGFILRPNNKEAGFTVIATSDNYFSPQILEVSYR